MKRVGLMFAGQGAQAVGMGRDLWEQSPAARAVFERADAVLGRSISGLCFAGPAGALTASVNCQPAIFTMSMACYAALRERLPVEPVVCGGLSLGELAAVTCAGVLGFDEALRLVAERGRLMDDACRAAAGAMAAVIGAEVALVEEVCRQHAVDVANYNCPGQVVISGGTAEVKAAVAGLAAAGVSRVVMLEVAGAYHSRLMAPAARAFAAVLAPVELRAPTYPVAQNVPGTLVTEAAAIRDNLRAQVSGSVRWEACVRAMLAAGAEVLVELGPGKVLTGFMRRIDRAFPVCAVGSGADLAAVVQMLRREAGSAVDGVQG
jgi:[acyl-carrier-protein] S-malonyltransferase